MIIPYEVFILSNMLSDFKKGLFFFKLVHFKLEAKKIVFIDKYDSLIE